MSLYDYGLIIYSLGVGKGMPMETGSCPKGGLAWAGADFSPLPTPPHGADSAAPSGSTCGHLTPG